MAVYLLAFELEPAPGEDRQRLRQRLRDLDGVEAQESLWLINSTIDARALHGWVTRHGQLRAGDRLSVAELSPDHFFPKEAAGAQTFLRDRPCETYEPGVRFA